MNQRVGFARKGLRCPVEPIVEDTVSVKLVCTHVMLLTYLARIARSALVAIGGEVQNAGVDRGAAGGKRMGCGRAAVESEWQQQRVESDQRVARKTEARRSNQVLATCQRATAVAVDGPAVAAPML